MSPFAILCPLSPFLARAVTARSATEDAVSNPIFAAESDGGV